MRLVHFKGVGGLYFYVNPAHVALVGQSGDRQEDTEETNIHLACGEVYVVQGYLHTVAKKLLDASTD